MRAQSGIYRIVNTADGKSYVGSAVALRARVAKHKRLLKGQVHPNIKLQRAWNKYGEYVFVFETLLYCSRENLLMYEQLCIDGYAAVRNGYNICPTAGNRLGTKHTPESLEKITKASQNRHHSEETKKKISLLMKGQKRALGAKFSVEARRRMSEARKGNKNSLGVVPSAETRAKLSEAGKGRTHTVDARLKISTAMQGNKRSLGLKRSPETIAKMRESQQRRRAAELRA